MFARPSFDVLRIFHDIWSQSIFKWKLCLWRFKRILLSLADGLWFYDSRFSMIQREFQLEVRTLIIQKSTVIPPSSMVLLKPSPLSSLDVKTWVLSIPLEPSTVWASVPCKGRSSESCEHDLASKEPAGKPQLALAKNSKITTIFRGTDKTELDFPGQLCI